MHFILMTVILINLLSTNADCKRDKRQINFGGPTNNNNNGRNDNFGNNNGRNDNFGNNNNNFGNNNGVNFGNNANRGTSGNTPSLRSLLGDSAPSTPDVQTRLSVSNRNQGSFCVDPRGRRGQCSFITEPQCSPVLRLIRRRGLSLGLLNYLLQAIRAPCGFDRIDFTLCCPQSNTPFTTTRRPNTTRRPITTRRPNTTRRTTRRPTTTAAPIRECGKAAFALRIVGGTEAVAGAWPWAAVLGRPQSSGVFRVVCGGTLITERHVLTAAHCFRSVGAVTHVRLGEHNVDDSVQDNASPQQIEVANIRPHEAYSMVSLKNDIALLQLARPAVLSSLVVPACLPQTFRNRDLSRLPSNPVIIGWGSTSTGSPTALALRQAMIDVVSRQRCDDAYSTVERINIGDDQVCAGTGRTDACTGDSGGPMLATDANGRWNVIGITSFGVECARADFPGVYTRVDNFLDWIQRNL